MVEALEEPLKKMLGGDISKVLAADACNLEKSKPSMAMYKYNKYM